MAGHAVASRPGHSPGHGAQSRASVQTPSLVPKETGPYGAGNTGLEIHAGLERNPRKLACFPHRLTLGLVRVYNSAAVCIRLLCNLNTHGPSSLICDTGTETLSFSLTSVFFVFRYSRRQGSHESESSQNPNFTIVNMALLLSTCNLPITLVKYG